MEAESLPRIEVDGAPIVYRRIGKGRLLVVLNGFGATSAAWDPAFIDRLASSTELILLNNRGIATGMEDIVIPASKCLENSQTIPSSWLASPRPRIHRAVFTRRLPI